MTMEYNLMNCKIGKKRRGVHHSAKEPSYQEEESSDDEQPLSKSKHFSLPEFPIFPKKTLSTNPVSTTPATEGSTSTILSPENEVSEVLRSNDVENTSGFLFQKPLHSGSQVASASPSRCSISRNNISSSSPIENGSSFNFSNDGSLRKFMEKLFREVEVIKNQVNNNGRMINKLLVEKEPKSTKLDVDLSLPCNSLESLKNLELFVKEKENHLNLISYLGGLGGKDVGDATRRILVKLLVDTLAERFNWKGKDKNAFKDLTVKDIVISAVRANNTFKKAEEATIENYIKEWLKQATGRVKKAKAKMVGTNKSGHENNEISE